MALSELVSAPGGGSLPCSCLCCTGCSSALHGCSSPCPWLHFPKQRGDFQTQIKAASCPLARQGERFWAAQGTGWAHGVIACPSSAAAAETRQLITCNPAFVDATRVCARACLVLQHRHLSTGIHRASACHPLPPSHPARVRGDRSHRSSL